MKRLLLILTLLCSISIVNAQSKLTYSSNIELGYESFALNVQPKLTSTDAAYKSPWLITANLNFGLHYWRFSLVNEVNTYFNYLSTDTYSFNVYFVDYRLDLHYKQGRYQLGYKHNCFHPIYSNHYVLIEQNIDRFYLKININ